MAVDTLKLYERFSKAGMVDAAAKEVAEAIKESNDELLERLTTKEDLIAAREDLKRDIKELELTVRREIDVKIAEAKTSLIIWVAGMMLAQTAGIGVLIKLLGN